MHANVCVSLSERADGGNWKACVMQVPDVSVSEMSDRVAGGNSAILHMSPQQKFGVVSAFAQRYICVTIPHDCAFTSAPFGCR
jgi:hypothetical protein